METKHQNPHKPYVVNTIFYDGKLDGYDAQITYNTTENIIRGRLCINDTFIFVEEKGFSMESIISSLSYFIDLNKHQTLQTQI